MAGRSSGDADVAVAIEAGRHRAFACALDWPGWTRSGRTPEAALAELAAYADRYRAAMAATGRTPGGLRLPRGAEERLVVVETLTGGTTTDFGAPQAVADADARPTDEAQGRRLAAALRCSWAALDQAQAAAPAELRKGPRGGGRDRDGVVAHVIGAEAAYARRVGVRVPTAQWQTPTGRAAARTALLSALAAPSDGSPALPGGWPTRYAVRRMAWHVLDHAWEIADRAAP